MPNYFKGSLFLLQIDTAASPGTYQTVAGLRSNSCVVNNEPIDTTHKTNMPFRSVMEGGIRTFSMTASGIFNDDQSILDLISYLTAGNIKPMKIISGYGDQFTGNFKITSFERSGESTDAEQFSISLENSGTVTYAGSNAPDRTIPYNLSTTASVSSAALVRCIDGLGQIYTFSAASRYAKGFQSSNAAGGDLILNSDLSLTFNWLTYSVERDTLIVSDEGKQMQELNPSDLSVLNSRGSSNILGSASYNFNEAPMALGDYLYFTYFAGERIGRYNIGTGVEESLVTGLPSSGNWILYYLSAERFLFWRDEGVGGSSSLTVYNADASTTYMDITNGSLAVGTASNMPYRVAYDSYNEYIYIVDPSSDPTLYIYQISDGTLVNSYLISASTGEAASVTSMEYDTARGLVMITTNAAGAGRVVSCWDFDGMYTTISVAGAQGDVDRGALYDPVTGNVGVVSSGSIVAIYTQ